MCPPISEPSLVVHPIYQIASSLRVELGIDDLRAFTVCLSKRIEEMNHKISKRIEAMNDEISRTAMNGTQLHVR
jgi:hypothetical protein